MKYVITIGREYGSGGRFIGRLLAEKLGIPFYDSMLLSTAAKESGLSEQLFHDYDEKLEDIYVQGLMGDFFHDTTFGQKVFIAFSDTIKHIADVSSCVIVGRCADYILRDYPNVVNIFICAPLENKIQRAVEYYGVEPSKAENIIKKKNRHRKNYYNFYSDKDWGKASSYDLCINSALGVEHCVDAIIAYLNTRFDLTKKDE